MYKKIPRNPYDVPLLGFVIGLIGPVIGFFIYYLLILASKMSFTEYLTILKRPNGFAAIISLTLLMNLASFLLANKFDKHYIAKGILIATFTYGVYIVYLKFLA